MKRRGIMIAEILLSAMLLFGCGASNGNQTDLIREDNEQMDINLDNTQAENTEDKVFDLTEDEIRILSETYVGEERIAKGKLYAHQERQLYRLRFAIKYLNDKYPEEQMIIRSCSETKEADGSWAFSFYEENDENGDYHVYVSGEEETSFVAKDDYQASELTLQYDAWLSSEFSKLLGQTVYTNTTFFDPTVLCDVENVDAIKNLGDKLSRNTDIYLDETSDQETVVSTLKTYVKEQNLYGAYSIYLDNEIMTLGENGQQIRSAIVEQHKSLNGIDFQTWND